jgi:hypothetical protein
MLRSGQSMRADVGSTSRLDVDRNLHRHFASEAVTKAQVRAGSLPRTSRCRAVE